MELVGVQVTKYKSIEDSTLVKIESDITVLVGENESGKTAFLEAIYKSRPLVKTAFNFVFDYPHKDLVQYKPRHDAKAYHTVTALARPGRLRFNGVKQMRGPRRRRAESARPRCADAS